MQELLTSLFVINSNDSEDNFSVLSSHSSGVIGGDSVVNSYDNESFAIVKHCKAVSITKRVTPLVKSMLKYINANYYRDITVQHVADSLFVSASHVSHELKRCINKTFRDYLLEVRLLNATKFILHGGYSVSQIASKVGYSNVRYFIRVFKQRYGVTPTKYI